MSWLDNVIGWISPQTAAKREAWRQVLEEQRHYDAGGHGRLNSHWYATNQSAEYTDRYDRDTVRARARDLERNSDMMNSVIGPFVRNVVGKGLMANRGTTTMKISMAATKRITATDCVEISGLQNLDGKYYVEEVDYTVAEDAKMTLSLRRVEKRFTKQAEPSKPVKVSSSDPEKQTEDSKSAFKKGDRVRVTKGAKTYTGVQLASFVYTTVYTVIQVGGKGLPADRVVIGLNGVVTAAVKAENLYPA